MIGFDARIVMKGTEDRTLPLFVQNLSLLNAPQDNRNQ